MAVEQNNAQAEEQELLEFLDGVKVEGEESTPGDEHAQSHEEHDDDDGEEEGDESTKTKEGEEGDEGSESIAQARQRERKNRRQRQREAEERLRSEVSMLAETNRQLQTQLAQITQRTTGTEIAHIDDSIRQAADEYKYYEQQMALGVSTQNGAQVTDASAKMNNARNAVERLTSAKNAIIARQNAPVPLDPSIQAFSAEFARRNPWYKHGSLDEDSQITAAIDRVLFNEGANPTTPQYWQELERRMQKKLPHRFTSVKKGDNITDDNDSEVTKPRRSPVGGEGRNSGGGNPKRKEFILSKERAQAIKDAGAWDDPIKRARMIKRYQDYDRAHKPGSND